MKKLNFLLFIWLLSSCANIVPPTGGEKDIISPKLIKTYPENLHTNFVSEEILFSFDEAIDLNNWIENFYISPVCENKVKTSVKENELILKIEGSLQKNTTYYIGLDGCIKDITEGNILPKLNYLFSTSNLLDTLKLTGTVVDAYSLKGQKNIWVLLYDVLPHDSLIFNSSPLYIARTDTLGNFLFNNLNLKEYHVFAISGNNLKYDTGEEIGFIKEPIIGNEKPNLKILLFNPVKLEEDTIIKDSLSLDSTNNNKVIGGVLMFKSPVKNPVIIQFLKNDQLILEQYFNDSIIVIKDIPPAEYLIKLIIDDNKNQKWDVGNLYSKKLPERIIHYPENIVIRSNWDLEIDWKGLISK